ncbi:hypothetical protein DSECCO2_439450 [anaerobic digester metagenome]
MAASEHHPHPAVGRVQAQAFVVLHAIVAGAQDRAPQARQQDLQGCVGFEAVLDVHDPAVAPGGLHQSPHDVLGQFAGQGRPQGHGFGREEGRGQGTGGQLLQFLQVQAGAEGLGREIIQGRAVHVRDLGKVGGGLHAAFDLEAPDPVLAEPLQVLDQAEVLGGHDLAEFPAAPDFPRVPAGAQALLQPHGRDRVVVAAGVGALAEVAGAVRQMGREQAAAGHGHAHGAVHKDLEFEVGHLGDHGPDAGCAQFAGHVDAARAQIAPEGGRGGVGGVGLGGDVDGDVRRAAPGHGRDARVGDDDAVHGDVRKFRQVGLDTGQMLFAGQEVEGEIDLGAPAVGQFHGATQLREGEAFGLGAQAQGAAAQVHRVGAVGQGRGQLVRVAGRGEKFGERFGHGQEQDGRGCPRVARRSFMRRTSS